MTVVVEFLSKEAIENIVTFLNFHVDRAIFLGFVDDITQEQKKTEQFLGKYCRLKNVSFIQVPKDDVFEIRNIAKDVVIGELEKDNKVYFDLTGGEGLILTAVGMINQELGIPMHLFNIKTGQLKDFAAGTGRGISETVEARKVNFNLDRYIESRGGIINYSLHKDIKAIENQEFANDVDYLWKVSQRYGSLWTCFSAFLREHMAPEADLSVVRNESTVLNALNDNNSQMKSIAKLSSILNDLASVNIIRELSFSEHKIKFRFKSEIIKDCLWDGGSILELHVYKQEAQKSDDCKTGVHLDWDGVLHQKLGDDVYNEIDVLCLNGYIPTFISCKNGKMNGGTTLHALYELKTVANHFGGRYARKILVAPQGIGEVYVKRAHEMGIEVREQY